MSFVPYGFLERGKPVEGYFKNHKTHFTARLLISQTPKGIKIDEIRVKILEVTE